MAEKKEGDLVQVAILTLFMCSIFFAGFTALCWWFRSKAMHAAGREGTELKALEETCKDPKTLSIMSEYKRVIELETLGSLDLQTVVGQYITDHGLSSYAPQFTPSPRRPRGGVIENKITLRLRPLPLDRLIRFLHAIEKERPDIRVEKLSITKAAQPRTMPEDLKGVPREWTTNIIFVSYTPRSVRGPATAKES